MDKQTISQWLESGTKIAISPIYYGKLSDTNDNNQGDFDNLFFFADDEKPNSIYLRTAIKHLQKRSRSLSDRNMKEVLNTFIAASELLFANDKSTAETLQYLLDNNKKPDYNDVDDKRSGKTVNPGDQSVAPSRWKRFNNWVSQIGDYAASLCASDEDDLKRYIGWTYIAIAVLLAIVSLIAIGFWGLVGSAVIGFVGFYVLEEFEWLLDIFCNILRFIFVILRFMFYNAWLCIGIIVAYTVLLFFLV